MISIRILGIKRLVLVIVACAFWAAARSPARAAVCTLSDHIRSANTNTAVGSCPAGTSHNIITITEDITLTEPLPPITGTITIEGGGHTISGAGKFRIFDVNGGKLAIKNLTLTEGEADDGGAVRLQVGQLSVYNSSLVGNRTRKSAGAIYASGGTLDISNSRFEDNCALLAEYLLSTVIDRDQRSVDGDGCMQIRYTRSEIDGALQTNVDGGAIRLLNGAHATIERSVFANNKATYGGAISTSGSDVKLIVRGSSFIGNRASGNGGAIGAVWTGGGTTSISNSSFVKNAAKDSGGAIDARENTLEVANSTFSENLSEYEGGALHVAEGAEVTVTHGTFIENRSQSKGDAISKLGGKLSLRNSIIASAGSAEDCVGGLDQSVGNLSPDRTCGEPLGVPLLLDDLTGSPAYYLVLDHSPALDSAVAEFCLDTDQLGTARPQGSGCDIGAVESTTALPAPTPLVPPPPCPLDLRIIAANTDASAGGCPAGSGHDVITLTKDIVLDAPLPPITSEITIEGNGHTISGDGRYRIFDVDGGKLTVKFLTMTNGNTSGGGAAIRLHRGGQAVVSDSQFIRNWANSSGGAIAIGSASTGDIRLTVDKSAFRSNSTNGEGGAIFAFRGRVTVRNSSFILNWARFSGSGAIGVKNRVGAVVENSTFIRNRQSAVAAGNGATATLTHVTIQSQDIDPLHIRASHSFSSAGRLKLRNSLIDGTGINPRDCAYLTQNIGNLIKDGACSSMLSGDAALADPFSVAGYLELQAGSAAIDAADPRFCPAHDQLGTPRPQGGGCDIGAIEKLAPPSEAPSASAASHPPAVCAVTATHTLNFRDRPSLAGARIGLVRQGATLDAVGRTAGWFKVKHQGAEGWISADYVIITEGDCG